MQGTPTERLQLALVEARGIVGGARPGRAKFTLRKELNSIARLVEQLLANWDQADKGEHDTSLIDGNFYAAGETYLDAIELMNGALDVNSPARLDEVQAMLDRAGRLLTAAYAKAQEELGRTQESQQDS